MSPVKNTLKDFDAAEFRSKAACSFKLGGKSWHCRGDVPWTLLERSSTFGGDDTMEVAPFFEGVLETDEVDDFFAMIRGPKSPLHSGNLGPLMSHIIEQLTSRPTKRPAPKARGSRYTPPKSEGVSTSRAGARKASSA